LFNGAPRSQDGGTLLHLAELLKVEFFKINFYVIRAAPPNQTKQVQPAKPKSRGVVGAIEPVVNVETLDDGDEGIITDSGQPLKVSEDLSKFSALAD